MLIVSIHGLLRALTNGVADVYDDTYVSIHGLLRALTTGQDRHGVAIGFNPRALTSPDAYDIPGKATDKFQSTGSYEP